jgi:uncharacterized protein YbaR (Trm112 family)
LLCEPLTQLLACPSDRSNLRASGNALLCEHGHAFLMEDGIPIFTSAVRREPVPKNMESVRRKPGQESVIGWSTRMEISTAALEGT